MGTDVSWSLSLVLHLEMEEIDFVSYLTIKSAGIAVWCPVLRLKPFVAVARTIRVPNWWTRSVFVM